MHPIQEKILKLVDQQNIGKLTLRQIGELIGEKLPQKVKHHLEQLDVKGFITIDNRKGKISRSSGVSKTDDFLLSIPIVGNANCGPATIYADENIDGYLKVSRRLLSRHKGLFAVCAQGQSLNKASINGQSVSPGDFVIVDSTQTSPRDNDYVLCVIDGQATIKKFRRDSTHERIVLLSESTQNFTPIFIHRHDDFRINGKAVDIVKKFES